MAVARVVVRRSGKGKRDKAILLKFIGERTMVENAFHRNCEFLRVTCYLVEEKA